MEKNEDKKEDGWIICTHCGNWIKTTDLLKCPVCGMPLYVPGSYSGLNPISPDDYLGDDWL